jgi:hypothetical protein
VKLVYCLSSALTLDFEDKKAVKQRKRENRDNVKCKLQA